MAQSTRLNRWLTAALLIPVMMAALLGVFTRLMADDYCYGANLRTLGLIGTIETYYATWFGRLTQIIGASIGSAIGIPFAVLFPALILALWLIALWFAAREIGLLVRWHIPAALPALILAGTLAGTPQLLHSLYWISGVFPYTVPLVLITVLAGLIARAVRHGRSTPLEICAAALVAFFAVTSSEPAALLVIGSLALTLIGMFLGTLKTPPPAPPRIQGGEKISRLLPPLNSREGAKRSLDGGGLPLIALAAALIAFAILISAPGNTLRQDLFAGTHAPISLLTQSVINAAAFIAASLTKAEFSLAAALSAFLLPMILFRADFVLLRRQRRFALIVTGVISFGLLTAMMIPNIYATSLPPPARVWIIPQFVLLIALAIMGGLAKPRRPLRWLTLAALIAVAWLVGGETLESARLLAPYSQAAATWDAADLTLRRAEPDDEVSLAPASVDLAAFTGLEVLSDDPTYWVNTCAAIYYDVNMIRVMEK